MHVAEDQAEADHIFQVFDSLVGPLRIRGVIEHQQDPRYRQDDKKIEVDQAQAKDLGPQPLINRNVFSDDGFPKTILEEEIAYFGFHGASSPLDGSMISSLDRKGSFKGNRPTFIHQ